MSQPPHRPHRPTRPTRTPTSRPRRVAGQARTEAPADDEQPVDVPGDEHQDAASPPAVVLTKTRAPVSPSEPEVGGRRRPTVLLVAAIVVLLGIGVGEIVYLSSDEEVAAPGAPSADRPVQASDLTVRSVVDQAVQAADLILSASTADYDAQVDAAMATMTDPFAEEFGQTKSEVREEFVAARTEVSVDVSAQGVVSATDDQIVALVFLTQTTQKGTGGGVTPVQYRVSVTMVNTADGWLVSDLQAL